VFSNVAERIKAQNKQQDDGARSVKSNYSDFIDNFSQSSTQRLGRQTKHFETKVFLKQKNGFMKQFLVKVVGKDICFYKLHDNGHPHDQHYLMHGLVGTQIEVREPVEEEGKVFYIVKIIITRQKARKLFFADKRTCEQCCRVFKEVSGFRSISDFYTFENKADLGEGKFGLVKLAISNETHQRVAIKVINKKKMKPEELELQRNETQILKRCNHPNIIKLIDYFETIEQIYLVLEYLEGGDLFDYLKERNFTTSNSVKVRVMEGVSQAVKYLHELGIIHRDLKLENVMMSSQ